MTKAKATGLISVEKVRLKLCHNYNLAHIQDELRLRRILKGLSQMAVAKAAGIQRVSLARYETGHWVPSEKMIQKILTAIERLARGNVNV
jgi:predicted transcriptional regulator